MILARHFQAKRHDVVVLSRKLAPTPWRIEAWDGRCRAEHGRRNWMARMSSSIWPGAA